MAPQYRLFAIYLEYLSVITDRQPIDGGLRN